MKYHNDANTDGTVKLDGYAWLPVSAVMKAVATLSAVAIMSFLTKLVRHRRTFQRLQRQGLPMPPHNFFLGHLGLAGDIARTLPSDFHGHYLASEVRRRFPTLPPIFYLDLWPTGPGLVVITSGPGALLIAQHEPQLPKYEGVLDFLQPLIGKHGLVTMEGDEWRYWRGIFNPGFNAAHLSTLVPGIVENTLVLCEILGEHASVGGKGGEMFSLFEAMSRLTMDMSCLATLGSRLNAQRQGCDLVSAFRSQASWIPSPNEQNLFRKFNPFRHVVYRYNRWRMDAYVSRELETHFTVRAEAHAQARALGSGKIQVKRSKAVVDLALETYLSEKRDSAPDGTQGITASPTPSSNGTGKTKAAPMVMDARFKQIAVSQMKLFLFAGYDTTASAAVYAIHLLSLDTESLQRARKEHDAVLGTDLTAAETAARISRQPQLLNRLPFTSAVIKESLRLYPPVSSTRSSGQGFTLHAQTAMPGDPRDATGSTYGTQNQVFETDGFMLWGVHQAIHRAPEHWPSPNSFIPDRWLVGAGHPLYPQDKEAWRPFEKGPRNCIGQELALLEVKVILAMVLRDFDFADAYAEYNAETGRTGPTLVGGDRAYQVLLGSSKPNNGQHLFYSALAYKAQFTIMTPLVAKPNNVAHVFPLISVFGIYVVSTLMMRSGHAQAFINSLEQAPFQLLPDGETLLRKYYTGFGPLDSYLANLQFIFIPLVDGSSPELSLLGWHWAGLLLAIVTVMLVESLRTRRTLDLILFVFWGLAIQYWGYFVTMPVYCYVHILRSTEAQSHFGALTSWEMSASFYGLSTTALRVVPISMVLGYVLPSMAMSLPWTHSGQSRQLAVAVWQNFPAWVAAVQICVTWWAYKRSELGSRRLEQRTRQVHNQTPMSTASSQQPSVLRLAGVEELSRSIRQVYTATAVVSALIHVSGLVPIVLAIVWPEGLFSLFPSRLDETNLQSLKPNTFFMPPRWDSHVQIRDMVEGSWNFLRYDYYIGTAAALLWAAFLELVSRQEDVQKDKFVTGTRWIRSAEVEQVLMAVMSAVVLGPGFAIVNLMSRREAHLLEDFRKTATSIQQQLRGISELSK